MTAVLSLWRREVVRFFRQKHRVIGALGTPLVFWLLMGSGYSPSFRGGAYLEYLFPGTAAMILMFAAIFSTISVIEDRREGFLQGVLAAPVPRWAIVAGNLLGGTTIALLQAGLFLALGPLAGIPLTPASAGAALAVMAVTAFGLTGLGFLLAWSLDSAQGFHAVMNLFLMPMWALSGALFPMAGSRWLELVAAANPMAYAVGALRGALSGGPWLGPLAVMAAFGAAMLVAGVAVASRRE